MVRRRALGAAAALAVLPTVAPVFAADGAQLFEAKCAACHAGGGNIVARGKTLDRQALAANGVGDLKAIESIVAMGQKQMPGFAEACAPKPACTFGPRLADDEITAVAKYVDAQADKW